MTRQSWAETHSQHRDDRPRSLQIRLQRAAIERIPRTRVHKLRMARKVLDMLRIHLHQGESLSEAHNGSLAHTAYNGVEGVVVAQSTQFVGDEHHPFVQLCAMLRFGFGENQGRRPPCYVVEKLDGSADGAIAFFAKVVSEDVPRLRLVTIIL